MLTPTLEDLRYRQIDLGVRDLVRSLNAIGIETDWSCEGGQGHLCIRATIQARTWDCTWRGLDRDRRVIEGVMSDSGIGDYWLSLVFHHGNLDTHGGEPTWQIEIPSEDDYLALPAATQLN